MQSSAFSLKISFHREESSRARESNAVSRGRINTATWSAPYPTPGHGIFTFNMMRNEPFQIVVRPAIMTGSTKWISLEIGHNQVQFKLGGLQLAENCNEAIGLIQDTLTSYWFSFDRDNLVLKYGKGYFMEETTLLAFNFLESLSADEQIKKRCELECIFGPCVKKIVELYDNVRTEELFDLCTSQLYDRRSLQSYSPIENSQALLPFKSTVSIAPEMVISSSKVDFYPQPLIVNWPFAVLDSSQVSLFELDTNRYIFTANLPPECQELYKNISAPKFDLNWSPTTAKYKLSDAIRYSFETEGRVLNEKLKQKKMKYIRVTVGPSRSTSPGVPYVLELWPKGMGSPVHCHGNSFGVIKVLHGGIRVEIYNNDMKMMIKHFDVRKGDVTWMSPYWYQSHRLFNDTDDFCATIQCYRYGNTDTKRWPYFDYINEDGSFGKFLPDGDFTFSELYQVVLDEYSRHMSLLAAEL